MYLHKLKPYFQKFLNPVKDAFVYLHISPTSINLWAVVFSFLMALCFYFSDRYLFLLLFVPVFAFLRNSFNTLDGMVARAVKVKNQKWGMVLNEGLDRLSDIIIFFGLAFTSYLDSKLVLITLVLVLFSSYLGILSKAAGSKRVYTAIMGKADRMFWLAIGAIVTYAYGFLIMNFFVKFIFVFILLTILMRVFILEKELYHSLKKK